MVSFLAAFALMCMDIAGADTRIAIGTCLVFVGFLVSWFIFLDWRKNYDTSMEHRTLTYYGPQEDKTDIANHAPSRAEESIASIGSRSDRQGLSQSPDALPASSKAESVRSKPASLAVKPQARLVAVFVHVFRCIYSFGRSKNRREDPTTAV
jgi:hypothetical protein